jgi:hypothetical protein
MSLICIFYYDKQIQDPDTFSNSYYRWLLRWNTRDIEAGDVHFLPTDVVLVVDAGFQTQVRAQFN